MRLPCVWGFEALVDETMAPLADDVRGRHAVVFGMVTKVLTGTAYLALACAWVGYEAHLYRQLNRLPNLYSLVMGERVIRFKRRPFPYGNGQAPCFGLAEDINISHEADILFAWVYFMTTFFLYLTPHCGVNRFRFVAT